MRLRKWKSSPEGQEDLNFFTKFMQKYNFIVYDGEIYDPDTKKQIRPNYMKSMLRRHYLESGRANLQGRALDIVVESFVEATRDAHKNGISEYLTRPEGVEAEDLKQTHLNRTLDD